MPGTNFVLQQDTLSTLLLSTQVLNGDPVGCKQNCGWIGIVRAYTDIDRDGHEISRFGGLPRELYFPKGLYFPPKRTALRENINILAPPTRDISSVPVNICYIRWSKWKISSKFDGALWLSRSLVTRLGVCVQTMWMQTWQLCALSIMTLYC